MAHGELIVYQSSQRLCVCVFTHSNMNISETSGSIVIKFFIWGGIWLEILFYGDRIYDIIPPQMKNLNMVILQV